MGTNFYLRGYEFDADSDTYETSGEADTDMNPRFHIGKRSAAGLYCWDCDITLCRRGKELIHHAPSRWTVGVMPRDDWHEACPECGLGQIDGLDNMTSGAAAIELGFAKPSTQRPTGVRSCSSFSWAQPPESFRRFAEAHRDDDVVVDEYQRAMTAGAFLDMLKANCPVQYQDHIGTWFC